jgi:hypothetical protein
MGRGKKYQPEQVVNLLRQIEVAVANGKATALACKDAGITEQSTASTTTGCYLNSTNNLSDLQCC